MNQTSLSPDDPRLTAYACNEMTPAERAEFEQLLESDPAARQFIEEIRATSTLLAGALEHEAATTAVAAPSTNGVRQAAILPGDFRRLDGGRGGVREMLRQPVRFPQFYYVISGLAAACFAVFFVYWQESRPLARKYVEVPLGTAVTGDAAGKAFIERKAKASVEYAHREQAIAAAVAQSKQREAMVQMALPVAQNLDDREFNTEAYAHRKDNAFARVADHPLSTFSIDVDTASYANVRRFLNQGERPPVDAVRIEELVNYFPYRYEGPGNNAPFAANLEVASAPWAPEHRLVRIGLKGREVADAARPQANLVFLLDVSGSMQSPQKLPLVKQSLRLLVDKLRADDRVAIAVYAGASGLALPSTPVSRKADILEAIDRLEAGGSTNGAMGIHLAYDIAKANFVTGGVNRVILATDGDFNVGVTNEGELVRLVGEKAKSGVFLSVLGFGMGNLKDATLEQLADKGNGNYAYIDSLAEAKKSLVEQAGGTLVTIAKDVKIQVEFNPAQVQAYRLIGYENRLLAKEDFNNDQVDAGEIGAGHTVTALYEVVPAGAEMPGVPIGVDALKYQAVPATPHSALRAPQSNELLTVKIRFKEPAGEESRKLEFPLRDAGIAFEQASEDFKFAAAVAGFGMILRESPDRGPMTLADVSNWARAGIGPDAGGYRTEFLGLAERTQTLLQ
jgi:Ca-activated chloride channel family protein